MDIGATQATKRGSRFSTSALVWGVVIAYLVLTKLLMTYVFPVRFERGSGQEEIFAWPSLAIFAALGLAGIWLAHRTGFPAALDESVTHRQRFLYPALLGLGFGTVAIALELIFRGTRIVAAATGNETFNIPFPASLFAYSGGAILVETLYRIFTLPFLLWLISNVLLRGRWQTQVFWVLAVVLAAFEPLSQSSTLMGVAGISPWLVPAQVAAGYTYNLTQNVVFRRYGILAPLVLRLTDYLLWHIIYGNFICNC